MSEQQSGWAVLGPGSIARTFLHALPASTGTLVAVGSSDPAERKDETKELYFDRAYARYVSIDEKGSELRVTPWFGRDRSKLTARFGGTPTEISLRSRQYGLRIDYVSRLSPTVTGNVGLDLEAVSTTAHRAGSISTPPRKRRFDR